MDLRKRKKLYYTSIYMIKKKMVLKKILSSSAVLSMVHLIVCKTFSSPSRRPQPHCLYFQFSSAENHPRYVTLDGNI